MYTPKELKERLDSIEAAQLAHDRKAHEGKVLTILGWMKKEHADELAELTSHLPFDFEKIEALLKRVNEAYLP